MLKSPGDIRVCGFLADVLIRVSVARRLKEVVT
jgi:hypothetical protein